MAAAIAALLSEGAQRLAENSEQPALEAEILLSHVTGKSRTHFRAFAESEVPEVETLQFRSLINQRRSGHPIAYLTGVREFWSLAFEVNPDVLIPRPETELLVEVALEWVRSLETPDILDLGTGSGAIPISIASERHDAHLTAIDVSVAALTIAQKNAARLGTPNVQFLQGDWLKALPAEARFDLIVSNPPYIPDHDAHLTRGDLRFEPRSALAAGQDGLDDIRTIAQEARAFIKLGGGLALEHGFDQAPAIQEILVALGYHTIQMRQDLQRHPRVTMARYG